MPADLICPNCQSTLSLEDQFCAECGTLASFRPAPAPPAFDDEFDEPGRGFGLREIGLIVVAVAVLAASVYSVRPSFDRSHTVIGAITLYQSRLESVDGLCVGSGEYNDLMPGGTVTVRNGDGDAIAVGQLAQSTWLGTDACRFNFEIPDVPRTSTYTFEVSSRDPVRYSRGQLEDNGWRVFLIAGDPPEL